MHYRILFCSWLGLVLITWGMPQGIYSDPAWGFKATLQNVLENSPSINHLVAPMNGDLSRLAPTWIFWWPAGSQIAVYPFIRSGVPLGISIRMLTIALILVGSLGWMRWISLFRLPSFWNVVLAIVLPWHHYAANALSNYSAEIFVFATSPWILILVKRIGESWEKGARVSFGHYQLVGILMGALYLFKYTGLFLSVGAWSYLAVGLWQWRSRTSDRSAATQGFFLLSIWCATIVLLQNVINTQLGGGMNPITSTFAIGFKWTDIAFVISYPAMALADADSLWSYILLHPSRGVSQRLFGTSFLIDGGSLWTVFLGLPGGLFLLVLITRGKAADSLERVVKWSFLMGLAVIVCLFVVSDANLYQSRYFFSFSFAILPWAVQRSCALARSDRTARYVLWCMAMFYVLIPFAYGIVSVVAKANRVPRYAYGSSHVYNPLLSTTDIQDVLHRLLEGTARDDVWYVTDPVSALDMRGSIIIRHADFMEESKLKESFLSSRPLTVHVVLPANFEGTGKGKVIRESFLQATAWRRTEINGLLVRWDADLVPGASRR